MLNKKVSLASYPNLRNLFIKTARGTGSAKLNRQISDDTNDFVIMSVFEPLLPQAEEYISQMSNEDIEIFASDDEDTKTDLLVKDLRNIGLVAIVMSFIDSGMIV